ncbi:MAG: prolipoprotein diacylglyceryl transferase, partial [Phycisphaerae bacterium]|nr:prolipoprotein diacylglyceryl transferase [Phycisphaerae bacterium]
AKKLAILESVVKKQEKWRNELRASLRPLLANMELYHLKPSDVEQRAKQADCKSLHVHPAQLYASVNAFLLAFLLNAIFHRRKRHGILVGILFILYPITRIVLEAIRADNPLDTGGLTVSQAVSVAGIVFGILWLLWIYRQPLRSPRAVAFIPPEEPEAAKA